jgi:hypothetical protein
MQLPEVPEFLANLYRPTGQIITGGALAGFMEITLPAMSGQDAAGVPQIVTPQAGTLSQQCIDNANAFASSHPKIAKQIGHLGLMRIIIACTAESKGNAPAGYSSAVIEALQAQRPPLWQQPVVWAIAGAGAIAAILLFRR